jgi:hypothetical protein
MVNKLESQPVSGRNLQKIQDIPPNELLWTAPEAGEHVRLDWRLVLAYLAIAVAALLLL